MTKQIPEKPKEPADPTNPEEPSEPATGNNGGVTIIVNIKGNNNTVTIGTGETVDKADKVAIRTRAKELKIASWHNKKIDALLAEIAEAEAKLAAPVVEETPADGEEVVPEAEGDKFE